MQIYFAFFLTSDSNNWLWYTEIDILDPVIDYIPETFTDS